MYNLREKVHTICNKPQEHTDTINDLIELFEATLSEKNKKAQDEINQLKQQHAEEISKIYNKFEDKVKGFRDTTETQTSLLRAVEIEKSHLESQYLGYRQAVKDILGGEG